MVLLEAPAIGRVPLSVDVERHAFLEIRDRGNRQLVTVLELLSPSNKRPGPDREQYLAKRQQLLASSVHLVELDLLRGGPRLPMEHLPACDYCVMVSRYEDRPQCGPVAASDCGTLPTIPFLCSPRSVLPLTCNLPCIRHTMPLVMKIISTQMPTTTARRGCGVGAQLIAAHGA